MSGQFDNKIVLITGAASGIGRAAALAFSRESASVVVSDLESDGMVNLQPGLEARLQGRIPLRRLGTAEEVAAAAVYLCSDQATFITGHSLLMDGGIMAE